MKIKWSKKNKIKNNIHFHLFYIKKENNNQMMQGS